MSYFFGLVDNFRNLTKANLDIPVVSILTRIKISQPSGTIEIKLFHSSLSSYDSRSTWNNYAEILDALKLLYLLYSAKNILARANE